MKDELLNLLNMMFVELDAGINGSHSRAINSCEMVQEMIIEVRNIVLEMEK